MRMGRKRKKKRWWRKKKRKKWGEAKIGKGE